MQSPADIESLELGHKVPWRVRLRAWWEGYDVGPLLERGHDEGGVHSGDPDHREADHGGGYGGGGAVQAHGQQEAGGGATAAPKKPLWSAGRIEVVERIWGKGFSTPGGDEHIPYLIKPFGLTSAMSVLDLAAGLGGAARFMAKTSGAWVTGFEGDRLLAKAAQERSLTAGLEKKATVSPYDPENFELKQRFDCVFAKEGFFAVASKDRLLDVIHGALKPRGQLCFTDYVLADSANPSHPGLTQWAEHEPAPPHPWSVRDYVRGLEGRGFDLRTSEDITDQHRKMVLDAWAGFAEVLRDHKPSKGTLLELVSEAELWARRVIALQSGLRVYRFYALKPGDAPQ
ncbi:MAG TPA: class I SAM-dependent methyltransferase [Alphaproteobacteria bacterium]|nr:class I SAM-dependent methyltransferase [Alphaproteobacteria bacterium]